MADSGIHGISIRARENWYLIPDVCVILYPRRRSVSHPRALLWIEILSADDQMVDVWEKARDCAVARLCLDYQSDHAGKRFENVRRC
jgi:hypothetical protein